MVSTRTLVLLAATLIVGTLIMGLLIGYFSARITAKEARLLNTVSVATRDAYRDDIELLRQSLENFSSDRIKEYLR